MIKDRACQTSMLAHKEHHSNLKIKEFKVKEAIVMPMINKR